MTTGQLDPIHAPNLRRDPLLVRVSCNDAGNDEEGSVVAKTPKNHGKTWSAKDDAALRKLAKGNTPTGLIAWELGRTEAAVRSHASEERVSLKPVNQSPYNRRKK